MHISHYILSPRRSNGAMLSYVRPNARSFNAQVLHKANLLGASLGLLIAYRLERYYRFRREVARLYQPLGESEVTDSEEELLPTHMKGSKAQSSASRSKLPRKNRARLGNVWDSREDFDIGSASESEEEEGDRGKSRRPTEPNTPQIVVSQSS